MMQGHARLIQSLVIAVVFVTLALANSTEDDVVERTLSDDYSSAVNEISFVEEFAGVARISGTCLIVGGDNRVKYRARISKAACSKSCRGGKDPRRKCSWNRVSIRGRRQRSTRRVSRKRRRRKTIRTRSSVKYARARRVSGTCLIVGGDNRVKYRARISKAACSKSCRGGKDPRRKCTWNSVSIRKPQVTQSKPRKPYYLKTPKNLPDLSHLKKDCCNDQHFKCMACKAHVSEAFFCKQNPGRYGCAKIDRVEQARKASEKKKKKDEAYHKNRSRSKKKYYEERGKKSKKKASAYRKKMKKRKKWAEQERKSWRREDEKQKESKRKEEQRKSAKAEEDKKDRDRHSEQEFKDFRRNVDRKKEEKRKEQLQKAKREDAEKEYQRQNKPKACLIQSPSGKVYVAKKLSRGDCKIQCKCRECTCSWNYRSFQSGGGSAGICRIKTPRGLNIMNEKTSAAKCQMECSGQ